MFAGTLAYCHDSLLFFDVSTTVAIRKLRMATIPVLLGNEDSDSGKEIE
jgi:hypothetical protein